MSEAQSAVRILGVLYANKRGEEARGKQFLGCTVVCTDGETYVLTYDEHSPYHELSGRRVVVRGVPFDPPAESQHLLGVRHMTALSVDLASEDPEAGR